MDNKEMRKVAGRGSRLSTSTSSRFSSSPRPRNHPLLLSNWARKHKSSCLKLHCSDVCLPPCLVFRARCRVWRPRLPARSLAGCNFDVRLRLHFCIIGGGPLTDFVTDRHWPFPSLYPPCLSSMNGSKHCDYRETLNRFLPSGM